jgi:hypothetical protein
MGCLKRRCLKGLTRLAQGVCTKDGTCVNGIVLEVRLGVVKKLRKRKVLWSNIEPGEEKDGTLLT